MQRTYGNITILTLLSAALAFEGLRGPSPARYAAIVALLCIAAYLIVVALDRTYWQLMPRIAIAMFVGVAFFRIVFR